MKTRFACLLLIVLPTLAVANDTELAQAESAVAPPLQYDSDPKSWGRVKRMVRPVYPAEALAAGVTNAVDIEVDVSRSGYVKSVRAIESNPKNAVFEEAVRAVISDWEFVVPMSARCEPLETVANAKLEFAVEGGKEVQRLTHRAPPQVASSSADAPPFAKLEQINSAETLKMLRYPSAAVRGRVMTDVYGIVTVDLRSGLVVDAEVVEVVTNTKPNARVFRLFADTVTTLMRAAKFKPNEAAAEGSRKRMCLPYNFRIAAG